RVAVAIRATLAAGRAALEMRAHLVRKARVGLEIELPELFFAEAAARHSAIVGPDLDPTAIPRSSLRVGIVSLRPSMPHTERAPRTRELPGLVAPVDPTRFVEVTGERIALLGHEEGPFECWFWPIKVLSDLRFTLQRGGVALELPEREITILPGELLYIWKGAGVQLRTEIFACRERPGLAFGFALDSSEPLELEISFRCDFRPMWPAGLGGQLVRTDKVTGAFALSEELGRFAVLIGASDARVEFEAADHALPAGPVRIFIPMAA